MKDVRVTLNAVTNDAADLTFKKVEAGAEKLVMEEKAATGEAPAVAPSAPAAPAPSAPSAPSGAGTVWVVVIVVLLILGAGYWYFFMRKK